MKQLPIDAPVVKRKKKKKQMHIGAPVVKRKKKGTAIGAPQKGAAIGALPSGRQILLTTCSWMMCQAGYRNPLSKPRIQHRIWPFPAHPIYDMGDDELQRLQCQEPDVLQ